MNNDSLLKVKDLKTYFSIKKGLLRRTVGYIKAVDGVSFDVASGKTLGLVGESGCGKTTTARTITRLVPATSGTVHFNELDVLGLSGEALRRLRRDISIIFQDPFGSLNPRMTISRIVGEPLKVHKLEAASTLPDRVASLLGRVGLSPDYMNRYPHEFSGGQRQRIGIARALALEPRLVICDEPVSALDVSIQSQILNLLKELQEELGLTYLFIAHDLAVVEFVSDIVAVMYLGRIVERANTEAIYNNPLHPYTRTLLSAIPQVDPSRRSRAGKGNLEVPSLLRPPKGCAFGPRCPLVEDQCLETAPALKQISEGHFVACWKCGREGEFKNTVD